MFIDKTKVPGHTTTFSGYPGALTSSDDFALMSSGLVRCSIVLT